MLQIFLKEGVLNKLSRKDMQPRMFFLVLRGKKPHFLPLPHVFFYEFWLFTSASFIYFHSVEASKAQIATESTKN